MSALIGTTLTPSAFNASQWKRKTGRFSSSTPTRGPWPSPAGGVHRQRVEEEARRVLQQQADAVAVAVAGLGIERAQPLDLRGRLAPGDGAGGDAVGGGGPRFG